MIKPLFIRLKKSVITKLLLLIGLFSFIWAWFIEPRTITITHVDIPLSQWSHSEHEYSIVLIADTHSSTHSADRSKLDRVVNEVQKIAPDRIFLLGDYVTGMLLHKEMPIKEISERLAPLVKVAETDAILGNHDDPHKEKLIEEFSSVGIHIMECQSKMVSKNGFPIQISGIPDLRRHSEIALKSLPKRKQQGAPHILLSHTPDILPHIQCEEIDLTVCGHTHGGQVCLPGGIPIVTSSDIPRKNAYGKSDIGGSFLVVTRGLGMTGLPIRLFCPPEIMVLHLKAADK